MMEQQPKILIADSDPQMSTVLRLSLSYSEQPYELYTASSPSTALLQLGFVLPDLIILDVTMHNGEGWDVLRRIRELTNVPVIALADRDCPELCVRSLERLP
jgi:DNA-binding response OmpR family regulator